MVNQDSKLNKNDLNIDKCRLFSDLLDEECSSSDFDDLLQQTESLEHFYRYSAVSAILKNNYSADASQSFCAEISAKIELEPAIIAAPSSLQSSNSDNIEHSAKIISFRRFTSGFAVAATVAFATFFSVQTMQVSDTLSPDANQSIASSQQDLNAQSIENQADISTVADGLEQSQLEMLNDLYVQEARRSDRGNFAPVSGEYVKTLRFSAEQWQAMVERAIKRQAELDAGTNGKQASEVEQQDSQEQN